MIVSPSKGSLVCAVLLSVLGASTAQTYSAYDDASWAVRTNHVSDLLGTQRREAYEEYMNQCRSYPLGATCDFEESYRMDMNAYQPASVYNYTNMGFLKTRVPPRVRALVEEFWERNRDRAVLEGPEAVAYHNKWDTIPSVVHLSDANLEGGGSQLVAGIGEGVREVIEAWTGMQQALTSVYGIRIYHDNSILTPHVDRMPLISSAIINVAQDVEEPWVLEVYDHNGQAHNVTMEPWDMVLYESHSVIHGRPFPLRGNYFANLFVHFEALCGADDYSCENKDLPPYIVPDSPWESEWRKSNPNGRKLDIMRYVEEKDLKTLRYIAKANPEALRAFDYNGWQPIHQAARFGKFEVLDFFTKEQGVSVNELTASGHTVMDIVMSLQPDNQALIDYVTQAQTPIDEAEL